ncbi:zinc fingers and homeoboxes protein 3 [Xenopus tropicalis]|uniref:Zinc fingers and homeoboxes 3 n=1 Tax=Xenopus tropicalis TaxID=8364 RepID=Q6DF25_XENTR|eukprot:NP_001006839.1 zinc fingers and homeoboxes protein 3 [Xenopus tropicalis]
MASKRKSTTPCMIPLKTLAPDRGTDISEECKEKSAKQEDQEILQALDLSESSNVVQSNGHENVDGDKYFCKYCNFGSHDTKPFIEHMLSKHTGFKEDPSYVCIACSFLVKDYKELEAHNAESHLESNLTWSVAKHESYTIVEQSLTDHNTDSIMAQHLPEQGVDEFSEISITKTPIMKIRKNKPETKKIIAMKDSNHLSEEVEKKPHLLSSNGLLPGNKVINKVVGSSPVVNGSIIGTVPLLQTGVTQLLSIDPSQSVMQPKLPTLISPVLTKPYVAPKSHHITQPPTAKNLPKVMIPLSSIPTYNVSMDSNCFLKNSFNKFPYPTKAELCYLTVVTKYPEEQIKIWFTAQRLKQGISWTPEEIEDSRKKMFNTIIQSIPQPMPQPTITVLNAPLVTNTNHVQPLIQASLPGHIVNQPQGASGLLVTQPIIPNGIQAASTAVSLSMTNIPSHQATTQTMSSSPAIRVVGSTRPVTPTSPTMLSQSLYDSTSNRSKKSRQQLTALKNSFYRSQFPSHGEVARLTKITGLNTRDVRKWFSDKRYHWRNKATNAIDSSSSMLDTSADITYSMLKEHDLALQTHASASSHTTRRHSWNPTPDFTPKYKERAPEQVRALEKSFFQSSFPTVEEVNRLRSETKMTRREIDSWFAEKRKRVAEENKKAKIGDQDFDEIEDSADELIISENIGSPPAESIVHIPSERKVNPIKINLKDLRVTESNDCAEMSSENDNSMSFDVESAAVPSPKIRHIKKTPQQREILKHMFIQTQWPTNDEYDHIIEQTGLSRTDVVRWFGDCRYSFKNGQLRWYDRYKRGMAQLKPVSCQPLLDYYSQHHLVYDCDLDGLCEQTGLTAEEVKSWFAHKMEEEARAVSEAGGEGLHSDIGDKAVAQMETYDGVSEMSENSESWEPAAPEPHTAAVQLEQQSSTEQQST